MDRIYSLSKRNSRVDPEADLIKSLLLESRSHGSILGNLWSYYSGSSLNNGFNKNYAITDAKTFMRSGVYHLGFAVSHNRAESTIRSQGCSYTHVWARTDRRGSESINVLCFTLNFDYGIIPASPLSFGEDVSGDEWRVFCEGT